MIGEQHVSTDARVLRSLLNGVQKASASLLRFLRSSPLGAVAVGTLVLFGLIALFAGLIAPHDPLRAYFSNLREAPSSEYLMGTDFVGRDVLSRIIYGSRITFLVAFTSITAGTGLGFIWGVLTGYIGGKFDLISQRFLDILMSFPTVILALLLLAAIGAGLWTVILAIAVVSVPNSTRVMRSVVLSIKLGSLRCVQRDWEKIPCFRRSSGWLKKRKAQRRRSSGWLIKWRVFSFPW